jgi:type IV pilus assembly protein PilB
MDAPYETVEGPSAPRPAPAGAAPPLTSLLEHLARSGVISKQHGVDATEWKRKNERDKRGLVEILEQVLNVPADPLRQAVAQYYAFRTVTLLDRNVRRLLLSDVHKIVRGLPKATFQQLIKLKLLPFDIAENAPDKLVLVTPNPADREIHEFARVFPYKRFEICYMKEAEWAEHWRQVSSSNAPDIVDVAATGSAKISDGDFESLMDREITRAKLNVQLDNVILDAIRSNASEVHITPRGPRKTEVLFRLDGHLALWASIDDVLCEAVATALKERAIGIDRYERQAAQQGTIERSVENVPVRIAVSVLPLLTRDSQSRIESIVLRIFRDANILPGLDGLGCDPHVDQVIRNAMAASHGLLLFAGSARDGAASTQAAVLRALIKSAVNALVIQDRVQFIIDGARQVKLNPRLNADDALSMITDHDPDIIMLGDLTSPGRAEVAVRLANIGHMVLATLPVRSAAKALTHLIDLSGSAFRASEAVTGIVAQQSLRLLCPRCRTPLPEIVQLEQLSRLSVKVEPPVTYRAVGCIDCKGGYSSRWMLYEAFAMTHEVRHALIQGAGQADDAQIEVAAERGGLVTMSRQAQDLFVAGSTTVEELLSFSL